LPVLWIYCRFATNVRTSRDGETVFYHRFVTAILNHPLVKASSKDEAEKLKFILLRIIVLLFPCRIFPTRIAPAHFTPISDWRQIPVICNSLCKLFTLRWRPRNCRLMSQKMMLRPSISKENSSCNITKPFDWWYIEECGQLSVDVYFRLLKRLAQGISVSFSGEPLSGLQVMGVLKRCARFRKYHSFVDERRCFSREK
jgi:hypothetical protein